jgi:hypothetical protein
MQFLPRIKEEPATVVVDFDTKQPVVTFWHEQTMPPEAPVAISFAKLEKILGAGHVGLWWAEPKKYSIEGYDDALHAMRYVHETREWLIGAIKGRHRVVGDGRRQNNSVTTESLHIASVILASDCPLIAFDRRTFVFSSKAAPIAALIHEASDGRERSPSAPNPQRATINTFGRDLCVDWMLASLACRDRLKGFVDQCLARTYQPDGARSAPMIEKRDGDRVLRISSDMPKTLRREFTRRF